MLKEVLKDSILRKASDVHIIVGQPPILRILGEIVYTDYPACDRDTIKTEILPLLNDKQKMILKKERDLDFAYKGPELGRFRCNVHYQRNNISANFRVILDDIPSLDELGVPKCVEKFASLDNGLVLVTGATGSGKSTTLAALIDKINMEQKKHIITIEDPIEFVYKHKKSVIEQREVGQDTPSFESATKYALRQDPDVIFIGELRSLETIKTAIIAAETGHLVLSTLHTNDAVQSIDRIINVFPAEQQQQIRLTFSNVLRGVISQQLIKRIDEPGRILIPEVLIVTPAVSSQIRAAKTNQIYSTMELGGNYGMQTMADSLKIARQKGYIDKI